MMPPTSIDGTDITGATIDGTDVQEITVDGDVVFTAETLPVAYSNLVAWYPFDSAEYGGSNADDVTAILGGSGDDTAYDGNNTGASYDSTGGVTDIRAGANSGAYDFAGTSTGIELPVTLTTGQTTWSITLWWDTPSYDSREPLISAGRSGDTTGNHCNVDSGDFDFVNVGFGERLEFNGMSAGSHHMAVVSGNGSTELYIDKIQRDTEPVNFTLDDGIDPFYIGQQSSTTNRTFSGNIDDVRFYNKKLSATEVTNIYDNTQP